MLTIIVNMKLYLIQHGKSLSKDVDSGRPLSPEGEKEVARIANFLQNAGVEVNTILHSGKIRAHQTAEILAEALFCEDSVVTTEGINPNDPVIDFANTLDRINRDTMIVGHLPFMARMVSLLVIGHEDSPLINYKPGSVVCLEKDENHHWLIQWMIRPDTFV